MKRIFLAVFCLALVWQSTVQAATIRVPTFEAVVNQSETIATGFIYEGKYSDQSSTGTGLRPTPRYCARLERIIFGSYEGRNICFLASAGLKIGVPYLLFLSESEDVDSDSDGEPVSYVGPLALEIVGPNVYHDFRAVRWEAVQHPIIPGLIESKATADYQDVSDAKKNRPILVYSYFPLKSVEEAIRQFKRECK